MFSILVVAMLAQRPAPFLREGPALPSRIRLPMYKISPDLSLLPAGNVFRVADEEFRTTKGVAVTTTRASTQSCEENGVIRTAAVDKPCISNGRLLIEPTGTNVVLRSEEIDNAAWTDVGTPAVTANSWDFGFGSAIGETLTDDDAAAIEGRTQTVATTTTGSWTLSCYMQSGSATTATLTVNVTGGSGSASCALTGLSTTTQRKSCTVTAGAGVTALAGQVRVGNANAVTGSIKAGGCQLETGAVATSYIKTEGTAAVRAAQLSTIPTLSSLSRTEGCFRVCITPSWTGAAPAAARFLAVSSAAFFGYTNSGSSSFITFDGTSSATIAAGFTAGVRKCYLTQWSASGNYLRASNLTDGTVGASAAFTTMSAFDANLTIGSTVTGTQQANSYLDDIQIGNAPLECHR